MSARQFHPYIQPCHDTYKLLWSPLNHVYCMLCSVLSSHAMRGLHSWALSPFLRSLSGGRLCVGCSDSSSISWVTASLWGLGISRLRIPQSPSAPPSCPWEAWGSILPRRYGRIPCAVRLTVPSVTSCCYL